MKTLPALLACTALAACAATPTADMGADGREWIYAADADGPRLAYGTPQSDDLVISFACVPRSGAVSIMVPGVDSAESGIRLASGGRSAAFAGETEPDQLNGGVIVTVRAPLTSPTLAAFARTGDLSLGGADGRMVRLASSPHTRAHVQHFFAACAG